MASIISSPGWKLHLGVILACVPLAVFAAHPAEPITAQRISAWPGFNAGWPQAVTVTGNRAFLLAGYTNVVIVDVSDPGHVQFLGRIAASGPVQVIGPFVYLADRTGGLEIWNVADPTRPQLSGAAVGQGHGRAIRVLGGRGYVAGAEGGLEVFDVSDPSKPRLLGAAATSGNAVDLQVRGTICYVATNTDFEVWDTADPANLHRIGSFSAGTPMVKVGLSGNENVAYLASIVGWLRIVDVSDPSNVREVWKGYLGTWVWDMQVVGTRVYLGVSLNDSTGIHIDVLDASDPANLRWLGQVPAGTGRCFQVVGTVAYVGTDPGLVMTDVSHPAQLRELGSFAMNDLVTAFHVVGNRSYLLTWGGNPDALTGKLRVLDLTDLAHPQPIGEIQTRMPATAIQVRGDRAYVVDRRGLEMFDVRAPAQMQWLGSSDAVSNAFDVRVEGTRAYLSSDKISVLDVADPQQIRVLGHSAFPLAATSWSAPLIQGGVAYALEASTNYPWADSLAVLDFTDPASPHVLGSCRLQGSGTSVAVQGGTAYVTDGFFATHALEALDVSDPKSIRPLGSVSLSWGTYRVQLVGNLALLQEADLNFGGRGYQGLGLVDVSDPAHMTVVGELPLLASEGFIWNPVQQQVIGDLLFTLGPLGFEIFKLAGGPVTLSPEPFRLSAALLAGQVSLTVSGAPIGASVVLSSSTDLASWVPWKTNVVSVANPPTVISSGNTEARQFYRASLAP